MTESIFRLTNTGDTEGNVSSTEIIEFNLPASTRPDGFSKLTQPSFKFERDVNFHPNPRRVGTPIQDSLAGILDVEVVGYFRNHLNSKGPTNLALWMLGDAKTPDFTGGRWGLNLSSFDGLLSFVPTIQTGYILYDIDIQDVSDPRDEVPFIARFYLNGIYSEWLS